MFEFLESDWFNISLEVVFVLLISYDIKKYIETKKREYLTNIVLTLGFAVWALYPYYKSYFGWKEEQKSTMVSMCHTQKDEKLCKCLDEAIFKEYTYDEYLKLDKNSTDFDKFLTTAKEDCSDDSWF